MFVICLLACAPIAVSAVETAQPLPKGSAPIALDAAWFPSRMHAFVWRNWSLIPLERMAVVVGAKPQDLAEMGKSMGLQSPHNLSDAQRKRIALTIIRRNWHLLPYEQMLQLLGWSAEEMAYTLREDDFFYIKLGSLKPKCAPLLWAQPTTSEKARAGEIAKVVRHYFPKAELTGRDPLFSFVNTLNKPLKGITPHLSGSAKQSLRLGYSYYALYGDPLIDASLDPYPDGYLARLAASGVNAVWLQAVLGRLAPLPWSDDSKIERRLIALRNLAARAKCHGIKVFLYLNEPRSLPVNSPIFNLHPDWRGVQEGDFTALCTSAPEVRSALSGAIASICRAVPDLGGFFTITGSENLTNCWSHGQGALCPRCKARHPAEVIAEVNATFHDGIVTANGHQRLLAWDWGWDDSWAVDAINSLPDGVELMSVSEWSLPIERGGVKSTVGEYSISSIGPGPRALSHWEAARKHGIPVVAKIQCANSWELSSVPYLPVVENVARHFTNLRTKAGVNSLMLGWTLGGHPSPNLQAIVEIEAGGDLDSLALRLHGKANTPAVVAFWRDCSTAFREFPFYGGCVYLAPLQMGPANPLWSARTGYPACMVGIPYDDLDGWSQIYPAEVFVSQLEKVATGFEASIARLHTAVPKPDAALAEEISYADAAAIHFASVAEQCRYVLARNAGDKPVMRRCIDGETELAIRLHALQSRDSRIGFEASNQYFYVPLDLVEKVINCRWLADKL